MNSPKWSVKVLILYAVAASVLLVLQSTRQAFQKTAVFDVESRLLPEISWKPPQDDVASWDSTNPLAIPQGQAKNLPSIRVEEPDIDNRRKIYGGAGDKKHLGGFTEIDIEGLSPHVWKHMIEKYGVKSVLDVGCGRGISTMWFIKHGVKTLCVEGSNDAVQRSMIPDADSKVIEHDFSQGPWWPADTYSACWAVEFLEHVSLQFQFNYLTAFRKCALIFATSSRWGGWHHVEVHHHDWWVRKFNTVGFVYDDILTKEVRKIAEQERGAKIESPTGKDYRASHVEVFVNPVVAALPEHAGLFPEAGCYDETSDRKPLHRECGTGRTGHLETKLAEELYPLKLTPEMDDAWVEHVKSHIALEENK